MPASNTPAASLLLRLQQLQQRGIMFGQQDAMAYGVGWNTGIGRSDCADVCGSQPALCGWDGLDTLTPAPTEKSERWKRLMLAHHAAGGINTYCWHMPNPVTGGRYNDTTPAVSAILSGGRARGRFMELLCQLADFLASLTLPDGSTMPVVLRLFHEFDAPWFWWGSRYCTPSEFIELWLLTHRYLIETRNLCNLLLAWAPDRNFSSETELLHRYPGDEWADIIGMDNYHDFKFPLIGVGRVITRLQVITEFAAQRGKLAALTETGKENVTDARWFTQKLYPAITAAGVTISYCMLWRNGGAAHHFVPYPGHKAANDFREFRHLPKMLFLPDIQD